jgi:gas vesicle protein
MADFRLGDYEFSNRRSRNVATALGFLAIGLGIGALAALLITPKTGKQIRKDVRRKYEDARDVMGHWGDRAGDMWERGEEWAEAARRKVEPVTRAFRKG